MHDTTTTTEAACLNAGIDMVNISYKSPAAGIAAARDLCTRCALTEFCLQFEVDAIRRGATTIGMIGATMPDERNALASNLGPLERPIRHGSFGGASMHRSRDEEACPQCAAAERRERRERYAARQYEAAAA